MFVSTTAAYSIASENDEKDETLSASGIFEVQLEPQKDQNAPAGRMLINKNYTGDLVGTGIGQMLSKRTAGGAAVYSAIEEFEGSVEGKKGTFTLVHSGYISADGQSLEVKILEGSGDGELKNISGSLNIMQEEGKHQYELVYSL
jgi:hypothetical protein